MSYWRLVADDVAAESAGSAPADGGARGYSEAAAKDTGTFVEVDEEIDP